MEPPSVLRSALLTLAFLAEVSMLVCLGVAGWAWGGSALVSTALAAVLVLAAVTVWGAWLAPRSSRRLARAPRWAVKVSLVSATVALVALADAGAGWLALAVATWAGLVASLVADGDTDAPSGRA